jgi:chorismate mutase
MDERLIGIRGATTVEEDEPLAIELATRSLLQEMLTRNEVRSEDLVAIFFSATPDITTSFPAAAARAIGLVDVPLFGSCELHVAGSPERCVRVMIQCYAKKLRAEVRHVYVRGAAALRSDLIN